MRSLGDNITFNNYPVFYTIKDGDVIIKCKGVYLSYNRYLKWKKDITKNILGYNKEGKECKIIERNGIVQISCLKDTLENLNKLELIVKQILRNDKSSNNKNEKTKKH